MSDGVRIIIRWRGGCGGWAGILLRSMVHRDTMHNNRENKRRPKENSGEFSFWRARLQRFYKY